MSSVRSEHLIAAGIIAADVIPGNGSAQLGQSLTAKRDHLEAIVKRHNLVELRQIEVDKAGTVGEPVV